MTTIKLPNFIKKQPIALGCALLCMILAVAIYFRRGTLAQAQAELEDKASQGRHLKENVRDANKLDEQVTAMQQATQAIEARLVHADKIPINLQYFSKIESETQTKLTDLRQTNVSSSSKNIGKTAYAGIGYSISVQGTYPQLLDFLRHVENGEHFSHVQGLTLSGGGGGGGETPSNARSLSININLELLGLP